LKVTKLIFNSNNIRILELKLNLKSGPTFYVFFLLSLFSLRFHSRFRLVSLFKKESK
jgi:hypothetical protein